MVLQPFLNNALFFHFLEVALVVYILACVFYGVFTAVSLFGYPTLLSSTTSFTVFLLFSMFSIFMFSGSISPSSIGQLNGLNSTNLFVYFFQTVLLLTALVLLASSKDFVKKRNILNFEFDLVIVFSFLGLFLLSSCDDLLMVYLVIELQSLAFYTLATFQRNSHFSAEAGLKYFVLGAFSSGLLLFGFSFLYALLGSFSFEALARLLMVCETSLIFLGIVFVLIAFLFKLGAFPFHMWVCDVYEGSFLTITALFSALPKIILFCIVGNLCFVIFSSFHSEFSPLLLIAGICSVSVASVTALYQKRVKRLLAYSTVSHTGFILLTLCGGVSIGCVKSFTIYLALYAIMTLAIFSTLFLSGLKYNLKYLINFSGLARNNLWYAIFFSIILFSIAGVPPLAGFYSKLNVFLALLLNNFVLTAAIVAFFSSVACFYYIKIIKILFFSSKLRALFWLGNASKKIESLIAFLTFLIAFFLVRPVFGSCTALLISLTLV